MKSSHLYCLIYALVIVGTYTCQSEAQFFTKTKSIPRMGRRADNRIVSDHNNQRYPESELHKEGVASNLDSLKSLVNRLVHIPRLIQDSVLYYKRKLKQRSK